MRKPSFCKREAALRMTGFAHIETGSRDVRREIRFRKGAR
jgi:hypothetical protein